MIIYGIKKRAGLLALSILLLMVCPMAAFANGVATVSIPDASADPSATVTVPINITDVTDLGGVNIWLYYDKNVVVVDSVANGDITLASVAIFNNEGRTGMTAFIAAGQSGDLIYAYVTLRAVGARGDTSHLTLNVVTLDNTSGQPIDHDVDNGLFTIRALMKGDFNGDGKIDFYDFIEFAAAYGSGSGDPNYDECADFNDDNYVDFNDFVAFAAVYGTGT